MCTSWQPVVFYKLYIWAAVSVVFMHHEKNKKERKCSDNQMTTLLTCVNFYISNSFFRTIETLHKV